MQKRIRFSKIPSLPPTLSPCLRRTIASLRKASKSNYWIVNRVLLFLCHSIFQNINNGLLFQKKIAPIPIFIPIHEIFLTNSLMKLSLNAKYLVSFIISTILLITCTVLLGDSFSSEGQFWLKIILPLGLLSLFVFYFHIYVEGASIYSKIISTKEINEHLKKEITKCRFNESELIKEKLRLEQKFESKIESNFNIKSQIKIKFLEVTS